MISKESEKLAYETRVRLRQNREVRRPLISSWVFLSIGFGLILFAMFFGMGLGIGIMLGAGALGAAQILNFQHRRRMARLAEQRTLDFGSADR